MSTSIPSTTSTASTTTANTAKTSTGMDRDAFLKLLVAQMKNQDPMQPMQGTEYVTQLSQFAMVEQSIAQSGKLDILATQMTGLSNNESTGLVGKNVTMRSQLFAFDGLTATTSAVTLDGAAAKMSADVVDADGNVVRTIDLGARPAGAVAITWDGRNDSGTTVPKGTYTLKIHATAADGTEVSSTQNVSGTVTKVSYEKGYPEITLDNGAKGPISDLASVQGQPATP